MHDVVTRLGLVGVEEKNHTELRLIMQWVGASVPNERSPWPEESLGDMMSRVAKNPISAAPIIMLAFSTKKNKKEDQFAFTDPHYMSRGSPELTPDDAHVWVTAPFAVFDSFDTWHGAAKWDGDAKGELVNGAKDVTRARQEAAKAGSGEGDGGGGGGMCCFG